MTSPLKDPHNFEVVWDSAEVALALDPGDGPEDDDEDVARAAGHDTHPGGEQLKHYWVYGEGAAKWSTYTELHEHLLKHGVPHADAVAAAWFHLRFGIWPGSDANRVLHGHPPRGHRVGPG